MNKIRKFLCGLLCVIMLANVGCTGQATAAAPSTDTTAGGEVVHQITWQPNDENLAPLEAVENPAPVPSSGTEGQRQVYLPAGVPAPWAGILLSPEAMAYIISEYQAAFERAAAALDTQRQMDMNRLSLEVGNLRLQLNADRQQSDLVVSGLNREIDRLAQAHETYISQHDGGFWATDFGQIVQWGLVIIGSLAVGAVVGFLGATFH